MISRLDRIAANYLKLFVDVTRELGHIPKASWFTERQQSLLDIREPQNSYIDFADFKDILSIIIARTGDHRLTFEFGSRLSFNRHGFLGYAMSSARTLRDALEIEKKYIGTLIGFASIDFEEFNSFCSINLYFDIEQKYLPYCMEIALAAAKAVLVDMVPEKLLAYTYANMNYVRPSYGDLYNDHLPFTLRFEQANSGFSTNSCVLNISNPYYDPALNALSLEQLQKLSSNEKCVLSLVKQYIRKSLQTTPTLEGAAECMHMSSRTLKRRLSMHGVTFSDLLTEARLNTAIYYLQSTPLNIEEIAYRLGYSQGSSFIQAFKRKFGCTPAAWLHDIQANTPPKKQALVHE